MTGPRSRAQRLSGTGRGVGGGQVIVGEGVPRVLWVPLAWRGAWQVQVPFFRKAVESEDLSVFLFLFVYLPFLAFHTEIISHL